MSAVFFPRLSRLHPVSGKFPDGSEPDSDERAQNEDNAAERHSLAIRCSEMAVEVADLHDANEEAQQRAKFCESALDEVEDRVAANHRHQHLLAAISLPF